MIDFIGIFKITKSIDVVFPILNMKLIDLAIFLPS